MQKICLFLVCLFAGSIHAAQDPSKDNKFKGEGIVSEQISQKERDQVRSNLDDFLDQCEDKGKVLRNLAHKGLYQETRLLLETSSSVDFINSQGKKTGDTALHHAVRKEYPKIAKFLRWCGARIDIKNNNRKSVFDIISTQGYDNKEIIEACSRSLFISSYNILSSYNSNNFGRSITLPIRYPNILGALSKRSNARPSILLIGPGVFLNEESFVHDSNDPLSKINNTSPQLAETLCLFPHSDIHLLDINDIKDVINNTTQKLPLYKEVWEVCFASDYFKPYKESLGKVCSAMKQNIEEATNKIEDRLSYTKMNALAYPYPSDQYDIILALHVFLTKYSREHKDKRTDILSRLLKALKPGGSLYIDVESASSLVNESSSTFGFENGTPSLWEFLKKNPCRTIHHPFEGGNLIEIDHFLLSGKLGVRTDVIKAKSVICFSKTSS